MPQEHFAAKLRTRNCKPHTDHGRLNWLKPMEASQRQSGNAEAHRERSMPATRPSSTIVRLRTPRG